MALAAEMLAVAGVDRIDPAQTLTDGTAMDRFRALIAAQGGDLGVALPVGGACETVCAAHGGVVRRIDALAVGRAVWRLGAGRSGPGQRVQHGAGIVVHRRPGDPVAAGNPCSACIPTPRSATLRPWPNSTVAGRSGTPRNRPVR